MNAIKAIAESEAAIAAPKAMLHLWVDWSVHARQSRVAVEKAVALLATTNSYQPLPVFEIDVSAQSGDLWEAVAEWLQATGMPTGPLMQSGAGPIIWMQVGQPVLHQLTPSQFSPSELASMTRHVFGLETTRHAR
jgi:hypothetical protein